MILVTYNGHITLKPLPMPDTPTPQPPAPPAPVTVLPPVPPTPPTLGVCIDSNGNIRLYHDEAKKVVLTFYIDSSLGSWPPSGTVAFKANGQPMHTPPSVVGNALTIYLEPQASGDHAYVMQYKDPQNNLQMTEPAIQNH
jgi:hypothetical protein